MRMVVPLLSAVRGSFLLLPRSLVSSPSSQRLIPNMGASPSSCFLPSSHRCDSPFSCLLPSSHRCDSQCWRGLALHVFTPRLLSLPATCQRRAVQRLRAVDHSGHPVRVLVRVNSRHASKGVLISLKVVFRTFSCFWSSSCFLHVHFYARLQYLAVTYHLYGRLSMCACVHFVMPTSCVPQRFPSSLRFPRCPHSIYSDFTLSDTVDT